MEIIIVAKTMMTMMTQMTNSRKYPMLKYCLENNVCYKGDSSALLLRCMKENSAVILGLQLEPFVCNDDVTKDINDDQRDDPEDDQGDDPVCNDDSDTNYAENDAAFLDDKQNAAFLDDKQNIDSIDDKDFRTRQWTSELVIRRKVINKEPAQYITET